MVSEVVAYFCAGHQIIQALIFVGEHFEAVVFDVAEVVLLHSLFFYLGALKNDWEVSCV